MLIVAGLFSIGAAFGFFLFSLSVAIWDRDPGFLLLGGFISALLALPGWLCIDVGNSIEAEEEMKQELQETYEIRVLNTDGNLDQGEVIYRDDDNLYWGHYALVGDEYRLLINEDNCYDTGGE